MLSAGLPAPVYRSFSTLRLFVLHTAQSRSQLVGSVAVLGKLESVARSGAWFITTALNQFVVKNVLRSIHDSRNIKQQACMVERAATQILKRL